jgi:MFS family permease
MPRGTLRAAPGQPAAIVVMALLGVSFFGAEAFVPLALTEVRGRSAAASGLPLTLGTLAWTAGAWVQERTAARHSRRSVIALGLALLLAGVIGVAAVLHEAVPVGVAYAAWTVVALGMGIAYSTTALTILEHAAPERAGESSAALQLATNLGIALGTGVGGALLAGATAAGSSTAAGIAAAWAASAAALVLALAVTPRLAARPSGSGTDGAATRTDAA